MRLYYICSSHCGPMFYLKHPGKRPRAFGRKIVAFMLRYLLQWIIVVHRNPKLEQSVSFHCICVYCNFVCSKRICCLQKTSLTGLVEFSISSIMCFCEINNTIKSSPFSQWRLSNCSSLEKYPCPGTELFWLLVTPRYSFKHSRL